jgi:hypothetical protein
MTELQDPVEVYRQALANAPRTVEEHPPVIQRADARPYPELTRIWVRVQISPFSAFPDLAFTLLDPEGNPVSTMFVVEAREVYQSLTLHLRRPPLPDEAYRLVIELTRDGNLLDTRSLNFPLTFQEPPHAYPE